MIGCFFSQEPFDADEYIERLAWRTPGGGSKGGAEAFDPKRYMTHYSHVILSTAFNLMLAVLNDCTF